MRTPLPSSLAIAYYFALGLAVLLGCCATYSGVTVVFQSVMMRRYEHEAGNDPATNRLMAEQPVMMAVTSGDVIFGLLTTLALGFGGGLGLSGRPQGRNAALIAFAMLGLGALLDVGIAIWSWTMINDLIEPASAGAVRIASLIGMIPSALWIFVRLAIAGVSARGLLSAEASAYYAQVGADGRRPIRE